jgi:hypothetical protein
MCEKCDQLTEKINRYERLRAGGFDKLTMDRIEILMVDLRSQLSGLHPQRNGCS